MPSVNNNQRAGATSNASVGSDFEKLALDYFKTNENTIYQKPYSIDVGLYLKKSHKFDLGNSNTIIECKAYTWTKPDEKVPSAKLSVWNEAMFYFHLAPKEYRKILFVQKDLRKKRGITLLEYYLQTYYDFIAQDVLFYNYSLEDKHCDIYKFSDVEKIVRKYF